MNKTRTMEAPTLKYAKITSHSLFEVMDKLNLFEIIQSKYLHIV